MAGIGLKRRRLPSSSKTLGTKGPLFKKRSELGIETTKSNDQRYLHCLAGLETENNLRRSSSSCSSMSSDIGVDSACTFNQRGISRPEKVLDTTASELLLSQEDLTPSWKSCTAADLPITISVGEDDESRPCTMTLQQSLSEEQHAQTRKGFHLDIANPSDHKTWVVGTPWNPKPQPMLKTSELLSYKFWIPSTRQLNKTLVGKYKVCHANDHTTLTTLARTLLATMLFNNPVLQCWRTAYQSGNHSFQRRNRCDALVKTFFEPGATPAGPLDSPFRYDNIPKECRISSTQVETVLCEWMRQLAATPAVSWVEKRENWRKGSSYYTSASPASSSERGVMPATPPIQELVAPESRPESPERSLPLQSTSPSPHELACDTTESTLVRLSDHPGAPPRAGDTVASDLTEVNDTSAGTPANLQDCVMSEHCWWSTDGNKTISAIHDQEGWFEQRTQYARFVQDGQDDVVISYRELDDYLGIS